MQAVRGTGSERFKREFQKYEYYAPTYTYIGWNNDHPIFRDKRVRQAMTYFTDRKQIVKTVLFGLAKWSTALFIFSAPSTTKSGQLSFDPKKAYGVARRSRLARQDGDGVLDKEIDGKRIPLRFEIKVNSGQCACARVSRLVLLDELKKHGIAASVRELDWTIFLNDVKNHNFDAVVLGWAMSDDRTRCLSGWHSSQAANKGSNAISYKNSRVDEISGRVSARV